MMMRHRTSLSGVALVVALLTSCTDTPPVASKPPEPTLPAPTAEAPTVSLQEVREHIQNEARASADEIADTAAPQATLPDLFDDTPAAKKTKFSGKILTREEAESLSQSVDGIQLEFEVKVD